MEIKYRHTSAETVLSFDRFDGKRVEFVLCHLLQRPPFLHLSTRKIARNPNCQLNEQIILSLKEARLLRDYLNRPEIQSWLEEEL